MINWSYVWDKFDSWYEKSSRSEGTPPWYEQRRIIQRLVEDSLRKSGTRLKLDWNSIWRKYDVWFRKKTKTSDITWEDEKRGIIEAVRSSLR